MRKYIAKTHHEWMWEEEERPRWTRGRRYYGEYAKSYQQYNQTGRMGNEVKIKSISFGGGNYCGSGWMGRLADMNGGTCVMAP